MSSDNILLSRERIIKCHNEFINGDHEAAYNELYCAIQEMPNADPYKPFKHIMNEEVEN